MPHFKNDANKLGGLWLTILRTSIQTTFYPHKQNTPVGYNSHWGVSCTYCGFFIRVQAHIAKLKPYRQSVEAENNDHFLGFCQQRLLLPHELLPFGVM